MEVIIPLLLLFILSVAAAAIASRTTRNWRGGRGAAIVAAFFLPGVYVAYLLVATHFRDDYHRRRSETYNFDGNCVVALGHEYKLEYYDEFPDYSTIILESSGAAQNYSDNGTPVRLLEKGVQRVGVTSAGVYGGASGRADSSEPLIDHYFFLNFADGSDRRFNTEAELRSAVPGAGPMNSPDELFSMRESKERSKLFTWAMLILPIITVAFGWYRARRRQALHDGAGIADGPLSG